LSYHIFFFEKEKSHITQRSATPLIKN
jgi:hypothetical protein